MQYVHPRPSSIVASLYTLRDLQVDLAILHGPSGCSFKHARLLEEDGICASGGSACNTGEARISYVIEAIKVPEDYAAGTVRMTLCGNTTRQDVDNAVESLKGNVKKLRG